MSDQMKPDVGESGIPFCTYDQCPAYDGKRCRLIGFRPGNICEPAVIEMASQLAAIGAVVAAAREMRVWGVELDDERIHYLVVQVIRKDRDAFDAAIAKLDEARKGDGNV
jgi:hypothetical protein